MSNLRSLLGTQSTSVTGIYSGGVGRLRPGQTYYFYQAWPCQTCDSIECTRCHDGNSTDARGRTGVNCWIETQHYNAYIMCCWKAPYGATRLDFELWGAGGGGATACCCSHGVPGGAGAYSRMTVRSGLGSVTAGIGSDWNYTIYWAPRTCNGGTCGGTSCDMNPRPYSYGACQPGDIPGITTERGPVQGIGGMTGYAGSDSWAVGCGLENFCAQGGVPGCAFCYMEFGHFITGFNSHMVGSATTITGPGVDIVGLGSTGHGCSCVGCCAMFYGCSGSGVGLNSATGAPGLPGAYANMCNSYCRHWNQMYVPYPGGLVNQCGGYIVMQNCGNECCYCSMQMKAGGSVGFGGPGFGLGSAGYVPGMGGMTAAVCGGPCCCGTVGAPGAARITVYYD